MFVIFYNLIFKEIYVYDLLLILLLNLIITNSIFSYFMKNPVYSLIFLILNYSLTGIIFIINGLTFLGIVFMLIYVGAISILLLFVIMLLNIKSIYNKSSNFFYAFVLLYVTYFIELFLIYFFFVSNKVFFFNNYFYLDWFKLLFLKFDFVNIGYDLLILNIDLLVLISIFLTIIMIAAINISNKLKSSKKQDKFIQLKSYKKNVYSYNN